MGQVILISFCQQVLLGVALLLLWRIDRHQVHVRLWGWSALLLGVGLALSIGVAPLIGPGGLFDLLAGLSSAALMASIFYQMQGTAVYSGLAWKRRSWAVLLLASMAVLAAVARLDLRYAVALGAVVLAAGNWLCAYWVRLGQARGERMVALCFVAAGWVNITGPLLDPLSRSPITSALGLIVQTVLSLGLILLSVARAHREARRQGERFSQLAEHSLQGLVVVRGRQILYANPAVREMFALPEVLTGDAYPELGAMIPVELHEAAREHQRKVLSDVHARIEWEGSRMALDGRRLYVRGLSSHLAWDGEPAELAVMIDETQRYQALQDLRRQALHDDLTDLPNRNFAVERLAAWTQAAAAPFTLLSADLDRFQLVNESLGHATGDALLRAVGARLRALLPPGGVLARLGEDQFLMLIPGLADRPSAQPFIENLLAQMAEPFELGQVPLYVHLSVGAAQFPKDAPDGASLLRAADSAMYRAKQKAGAAYAFFSPSQNQAAQLQLQAEQGLSRALIEDEFFLEYQPKYLAHSRALCGFEALVRWQRPGLGRVSPADFIPAAERTGQIRELGDLILRIACDQLRDWREEFGRVLPVAVNVSPLQFEDADLVDRILRYLDERELPHAALQLEITESAAIGRMDRVLPQLARLREAGIKCALDDFGTGQSSLTMLGRLPIDAMKLDRSMISPLPGLVASALVQAACVMGESLKLDIVAEGVETEVQAQSAEALGCTQLQGFYLSRPLAAPLAGALLETLFKR